MCNLCDPETRVASREWHLNFADRLEKLAQRYRDLGTGRIKPHGDKATEVGSTARSIVRTLVEDWV